MKAASEGYSVSLEGKVLQGRFRIDKRIGRGGMAWLFKAWDQEDQKYVAIKLLFPHLAEDEILRARFVKEAQMQQRLEHPHIVHIMTLVEQGELIGSVMEWVDGEDLKQTIKRHKGPMELEDLKSLCLPMLDALGFAHANGLVHRDIKPANILLFWKDGRPIPKLTDFGIAKALEETEGGAMTSTGSALGTMRYMSPEQIRDSKNVDHRADLYSFGVVMYQLATGEPPFRGSTENLMFKQLYEPPPPPTELCPALPASVEQVILRCLQKKPEDRYESCPVLKEALEEAISLGMSDTSIWDGDLEEELTIKPTDQARSTQALRPALPGEKRAADDDPSGSLPSGSLNDSSQHSFARDDSSANSASHSFSNRLQDDIHADASSPNIHQGLETEKAVPPAQEEAPSVGISVMQDNSQGPTIQGQPFKEPTGIFPHTEEATAQALSTSPFATPPQMGPAKSTGVATLASPSTRPNALLGGAQTAPPTFDHLPATPFGQGSPFGQTQAMALPDEDDYFSEDEETVIAQSPHSKAAQERAQAPPQPTAPIPTAPIPTQPMAPPTQPMAQPTQPMAPPTKPMAPPTQPMAPAQASPFPTMPPLDASMATPSPQAPHTPTPTGRATLQAEPTSPNDIFSNGIDAIEDERELASFPGGFGPRPAWQRAGIAGVVLLLLVLLAYAFSGSAQQQDPPDQRNTTKKQPPQVPNRLPPLDQQNCTTGQRRSCYDGPKGTLGKGRCKAGRQICQGGRWSQCSGAQKPTKESCNGIDDNCNGQIDEITSRKSCSIRIDGCRYRGTLLCNSRRRRSYCRVSSGTIAGVKRAKLRISPSRQTFTLRFDGGEKSFRRKTCIELSGPSPRVSVSAPGYALCVFPLPYREKTWYIRMQRKSMMEPAANYCIRQ